MNPAAVTAPPRLFETACRVWGPEPPGGGPRPWGDVAFTLDLDALAGVRENYPFEADDEGVSTVVDLCNGDSFRLLAPYAAVRDAWRAYRTHADKLDRLRN